MWSRSAMRLQNWPRTATSLRRREGSLQNVYAILLCSYNLLFRSISCELKGSDFQKESEPCWVVSGDDRLRALRRIDRSDNRCPSGKEVRLILRANDHGTRVCNAAECRVPAIGCV